MAGRSDAQQQGAGVIGFAELGLTGIKIPGQTDAAFWSWAIFGAAVLFLVLVYFGLGGTQGSVAS